MEVLGAGALMPVAAMPLAAAQVPAPPKEGKDTPKIALGMGDGGGGFGGGRGGAGRGGAGAGPGAGAGAPGAPAGADGAAANTPPPDPMAGPRRIKQLGVNHVLGGGGGVPCTEQSLNATMER